MKKIQIISSVIGFLFLFFSINQSAMDLTEQSFQQNRLFIRLQYKRAEVDYKAALEIAERAKNLYRERWDIFGYFYQYCRAVVKEDVLSLISIEKFPALSNYACRHILEQHKLTVYGRIVPLIMLSLVGRIEIDSYGEEKYLLRNPFIGYPFTKSITTKKVVNKQEYVVISDAQKQVKHACEKQKKMLKYLPSLDKKLLERFIAACYSNDLEIELDSDEEVSKLKKREMIIFERGHYKIPENIKFFIRQITAPSQSVKPEGPQNSKRIHRRHSDIGSPRLGGNIRKTVMRRRSSSLGSHPEQETKGESED